MNFTKRLVISASAVFFSVGCAATSVTNHDRPLYSINCDDVGNYSSERSDEKYVVRFLNSRDESIDMYWIDYEGEEVLKGSISPKGTWSQNTYVTHPWVARDKSGICVAAYDSSSSVLVNIR